MSNLKVVGTGTGYTLISNVFIDKYMITSGSSHLKTYLLLIRLLSDPQKEISISGMADILDCSESDVLRSLRHWEKKGLMKLQYEESGKILSGIVLLDFEQADNIKSARQEVTASQAPHREAVSGQIRQQKAAADSERKPGSADSLSLQTDPAAGQGMENRQIPEYKNGEEEPLPPRQVNFAAVSGDENFSRLMFIAEQYIGAPLSRADCESFAWLYDRLKMDTALLEYLVEYCVTNGHRSVRYMETVAIDWHRKKIKTVEQARIYTPLHNKNLYAVMKALGLNGRQPAPSERKIIDKWFQEYGFSLDMVVEACNRTMISIHEPNLNYVESILSRWKKAGISRLDQVQGLDEKFQKQKGGTGKGGEGSGSGKDAGKSAGGGKNSSTSFRGYGSSGKKPGAQFHDFEQRNYDYDELLKQINSTD